MRPEIVPYLDQHELIKPKRNEGSNNGVLYTSLWYIALILSKQNTVMDWLEFKRVMTSKCIISPGLLQRSPSCSDQEGPDDYIGYTTALALMGMDHVALLVFLTGQEKVKLGPREYQWVYNNRMPGTLLEPKTDAPRKWHIKLADKIWAPEGMQTNFSAWFGRMPQNTAHITWAAGLVPPLWARAYAAWVCVARAHTKEKSDVDARILSLMLILVAHKKCWMMKMAGKQFLAKLKEQYPGGLKELFSMSLEPGHPVVELMPAEITLT